jgi:hypothetical protein
MRRVNQIQIDFIKELDPESQSGTIQSILLRDDLNMCNYTKTLEHLLQVTIGERKMLIEENMKLSKILKDRNLYHLILEE